MRLPYVTDEMLHAVLHAAVPPVFVQWVEAGSQLSKDNYTRALYLMENYDARAIFVRIIIDENPSYARHFGVFGPTFTIHLNNRKLAHMEGEVHIADLRGKLETALGQAPSPPSPPCAGV